MISVEPGASNVIPQVARLVVDARAPDDDRVADLERRIRDTAERCAGTYGCTVAVGEAARTGAVRTDPLVRGAAKVASNGAPELPSGAGHDAQALAAVARSGMLFVPSQGGVSHSPREHTAWEDCVNGANVLLGAALALA